MEKSGGTHSWWKIVVIVVNVVLFAGQIVVSSFANGAPNPFSSNDNESIPANGSIYNTSGRERNIFLFDDIRTKDRRYADNIGPASWVFLVWFLIYAWQFSHMIYSLSLIFRRNSAGEYLYTADKPHIHISFYLAFMLGTCGLISWNFVYDRGILLGSFLLLILVALSVYVAGVIAAYSLDKAAPMLEKSKLSYDIWLTRMLTLNGVAFYGAWSIIAVLLQMQTFMENVSGVKGSSTIWIILGILTAKVITWFVMETFAFDRYLRYLFSPYLALLVTVVAIIDERWISPVPDNIYFVGALTSLIGVFALVKGAVMFLRGHYQPIKYSDEQLKSDKYNEMNPL